MVRLNKCEGIPHLNKTGLDNLDTNAAMLAQGPGQARTLDFVQVPTRWPWFLIAKHGLADLKVMTFQVLDPQTTDDEISPVASLFKTFRRTPASGLCQVERADQCNLAGIGGLPEALALSITVIFQTLPLNRLRRFEGHHRCARTWGDKYRLQSALRGCFREKTYPTKQAHCSDALECNRSGRLHAV